jgi:hypothetical protein
VRTRSEDDIVANLNEVPVLDGGTGTRPVHVLADLGTEHSCEDGGGLVVCTEQLAQLVELGSRHHLVHEVATEFLEVGLALG